MQEIKDLIVDVGDKVFKPQLDLSMHDQQTELMVQHYAGELAKNRIVVNYIVLALLHGRLCHEEANGLMKRASTPDGLNNVYTNLIDKVSEIILKPSDCKHFKVAEPSSH